MQNSQNVVANPTQIRTNPRKLSLTSFFRGISPQKGLKNIRARLSKPIPFTPLSGGTSILKKVISKPENIPALKVNRSDNSTQSTTSKIVRQNMG